MRGEWQADNLLAQLNSVSKVKYSVVSCGSGTYSVAIPLQDGAYINVSPCVRPRELVHILDALVRYAQAEARELARTLDALARRAQAEGKEGQAG